MQRGRFEEVLVDIARSVHWLLPLDQELIVHVQIERYESNVAQIRAETRALLSRGVPLARTG